MNDSKFHIQVKKNKGKIGASADGVAMFYYKVPVKSKFTITANATVNSFDLNDQVSFGLMARDDMYIDENRTDVLGDYVAAGPLKLATAGGVGTASQERAVFLHRVEHARVKLRQDRHMR